MSSFCSTPRHLIFGKANGRGGTVFFLTHANLLLDGSNLRLRWERPEDCSIAIFPAPSSLTDGRDKAPAKADGLFRRFSPRVAPVAAVPADADFAQTAVWRVKLPAGLDASRDLRLRVRYTGDVIRAYHGDKLVTDDFYHARPVEIGLRRPGPAVYQDGRVLTILPLREDAPIYITDRSELRFDDNHTALTLDGVDVIETREVRLSAV